MNAKLMVAVIAAAGIGYFFGSMESNSRQEIASTNASTDVKLIEGELNKAKAKIISLNKAIASLDPEVRPKDWREDYAYDDSPTSNDNQNTSEQSGDLRLEQLQAAHSSLEQGDFDAAMMQFNELLAAAQSESERDEAIDGLIALREAQYQAIMQDGNYIHGAMWQLFEIHKLRPDQLVSARAKALSQDILFKSNEYLAANDLLSGADYLNSLVHTTNMMGYEVEGVDRNELVSRVKEIESQPEYQQSLYLRATNNLMNGSDLEKSIVFWDFAKLAEIDGENRLRDPSFNSQFVDATLVHLNHLKDMNQAGEVNSRMSYIRYAFPYLMDDSRISGFF